LNDIVTLKSGLEVTQGHSDRYHSKAWLWFYIHLWLYLASIPRYLPKIMIFSYPLSFDAAVRGFRRNMTIPFGVEKLEWWSYPMVKRL